MKSQGTLLLSRSDVAGLLNIEQYIAAVELVFRLYGESKTQPPGYPLAILDSMEITVQRTGAATAEAAKYLARPDSRSILICGCGNQGRVSIRALSKSFSLEHVFAYDLDSTQAERFASELSAELKIPVESIRDLGDAMKRSDICVTSTPSTRFFLKHNHVRPGTFIAAVGADSETKQELEPTLIAKNKTVVDMVEQCASIGELHHAIASNLITKQQVHAELGEVVAGTKHGSTSPDEIIIFDSTGMALHDVIAAATVFTKAVDKGVGRIIKLDQ